MEIGANMTFPEETILKPVILTQSAANAVRDVMNKRNLQGYALRVYIAGGGCSGYQYALALDSHTSPEDMITETGRID
jgi:iron-sulfur cluster assembly accessory protein